MCIALIAINQHPLFPLIILSNRDEYYQRSFIAADFLQEASEVFCGKDLTHNGTWLGVTTSGRVALVTNYRNPAENNACLRSRGNLVKDYLCFKEDSSPLQYLKQIEENSNNYNKFNLIVGHLNDVLYYSNVEKKIKTLTRGIHCISNHLLNTNWFKTIRLKSLFIHLFKNMLKTNSEEELAHLLHPLLLDKELASDNRLPNTGMTKDLEILLSPIFVQIPKIAYGTTNSTVIVFSTENIFFSEKIYNNGHFKAEKTTSIPILASKPPL